MADNESQVGVFVLKAFVERSNGAFRRLGDPGYRDRIVIAFRQELETRSIKSVRTANLEGLTSMLPILRTGEAIVLGEAVKLPMRTTIKAPPPNKRPDSQDPVVYDEAPLEETQNPGGWGIPMESDPRYDELVEAWRAQNPKITRVR